jgi:hypothetical protein
VHERSKLAEPALPDDGKPAAGKLLAGSELRDGGWVRDIYEYAAGLVLVSEARFRLCVGSTFSALLERVQRRTES